MFGIWVLAITPPRTTSSQVNMMSSTVNSTPSDHFTPGRRWKMTSLPSSEISQLSARLGSMLMSGWMPAGWPIVSSTFHCTSCSCQCRTLRACCPVTK